MKRIILSPFIVVASLTCAFSNPVDYVKPLMGTLSSYELSNGNTYPIIALPWGMNFWTPQTGAMGDGWQYTYTANKIRGLKQTHQPSPWIGDYGQFSIMPTIGEPIFDENARASWFSHKAETATPYYYSVYLADYDITAEITPTERAAIMRFTYPESNQANVVIDACDGNSFVSYNRNQNMIYGWTTKNSGGVPDNFRNYFVIVFNQSIDTIKVVDDDSRRGVIATFNTFGRKEIEARVASSFISHEQALRNLNEVAEHSFNDVKQQAFERWNNVLGRIEIVDDNLDNKRTFYSCLYRSVLFPRMFYEINQRGEIVHYSPYNGKVERGYMFTDTGFWDTFRCLFPLLNLVFPERVRQMMAGLANSYRESGFLPEWASPGHRDCMVGNNSASIVADAYLKGNCSPSDVEVLWDAVCHGANNSHPTIGSTGRKGHDYYNRLGYVPYDVGINESVARTLEYAYSDWCIYTLGHNLGKPTDEIEPYRLRSYNYLNVFDTNLRLMRGRNTDGTFQTPFNPLKWGDAFTEGNAWHYTWSVFHDAEGLAQAMGGDSVLCNMLDSVFLLPPLFDESYYGTVIHEIREMQITNMGNYAHGNQPIQHMTYLYNYSLEPWKSQYWVREIMNRLYSATPDGYCGDEDNGQTSAWYVFSALGFYPVCPGSNQYVIGTPLFKQAVIHLPTGKDITITATNHDYPYIDTLLVNGKNHPYNFFTHADLVAGCHISFFLSPSPNTSRGTTDSAKPYSMTKPKKSHVKTD